MTKIETPAQTHARTLGKLAPEAVIITDENALAAYECDAYSAYRERPLLAILPISTAEVAAIMRYARDQNLPIVARGAGTSLVGGSMPKAGGIVLGLSRMRRVLDFDPDDRMIHVETGITNLAISDYVRDEGLFYAPDPSSQMACSVGGNIAMNSGGAHCLKYGVTTNHLIAARLVTLDGDVLEFHGDDGLDVRGLICGSEGQLGVVTEAWLRLETRAERALPMLIAFNTPEAAGECVAAIIRAGLVPVAIEYMDEVMIREVENFAKAGYPLAAALLIVEVEGNDDRIAADQATISDIARGVGATEIRAAASEDEATRIWAGRKAAFGVMGRLADYITLDGCVPISRLPEALAEIKRLADAHGHRVTNVFHAGDGNLHPLIMYDAQVEGQLASAEALGAAILRKCVAMGGCLTGEHGVGIEKRELMFDQWNADELGTMVALKEVFDPNWRLNPDKVFPLTLRAEARS